MADIQTWENLPKSQSDGQTIGDYIAEAIAVHMLNSEAHLGVDGSLESHRVNNIIDHPAESVVNDKLQVTARRYIAIVDPADSEAFDTMAGAIAYAESNGYGDIYLVAGEHYFTGNLHIDPRISVYGAGSGETYILATDEDSDTITFWDSGEVGSFINVIQTVEGVTFGKSGNAVGFGYTESSSTFVAKNCVFDYIMGAIVIPNQDVIGGHLFDHCRFNYRSISSESNWISALINLCDFFSYSYSGVVINGTYLTIIDCRGIIASGSSAVQWFPSDISNVQIVRGRYMQAEAILDAISPASSGTRASLEGVFISMASGNRFDVIGDYVTISECTIIHASGQSPRLAAASNKCLAIGNYSTQAFTNSGTNNILDSNIVI